MTTPRFLSAHNGSACVGHTGQQEESAGRFLPANTGEADGLQPALVARTKPPLCKVAGSTDAHGHLSIKLDHEPGALLACFGDRGDEQIGAEPPPFSAQAISDVLQIALGSRKLEPNQELTGQSMAAVNAMLQAASAFEPTNEAEGMIALQAAALHHVTMYSLACGMRSERNEFRQAHLSTANKSARTFAVLVETLNRSRGKTTTQRVIVENVNVQAGGQAVVGAVATGAGAQQSEVIQSHAFTERGARRAGDCASITALPCANSERQAVSASGGEGAEAMPDARRRRRRRRTKGQSEPVGARALLRGRGDDAAHDARADEGRAPNHLRGAV